MLALLKFFDPSTESFQSCCRRLDIYCPNITVHFETCNRCQQGWILFYTVDRLFRGHSDEDIERDFYNYQQGHRHQAIQRKQRRMYMWYVRNVKNRKIPKSVYYYFNMIRRRQSKYKLTRQDVSKQFKALPHGSLIELKQRYDSFKRNPVLPESQVIRKYCDHYKLVESVL